MLMPKRVKRRKVQRGRMKGKALRGNTLAYGTFGIIATEPCWIKSNQIEAARIALTRYIKRGGKVWIKIFPDKPVTQKYLLAIPPVFWKPVQSKPAYTVSAFVQLQFLNWAQHHNRYHPEFFLFQVF